MSYLVRQNSATIIVLVLFSVLHVHELANIGPMKRSRSCERF